MIKVRLLLVDTPETQDVGVPDCYGPEAKEFTSKFRFHPVKLAYESKTDCKDHYDRYLAYVTPTDMESDKSINEQLIANGFARVCRIECDESRYEEFAELETEAKDSDVGLWNADSCPDSRTLSSWGASGCNGSCR